MIVSIRISSIFSHLNNMLHVLFCLFATLVIILMICKRAILCKTDIGINDKYICILDYKMSAAYRRLDTSLI